MSDKPCRVLVVDDDSMVVHTTVNVLLTVLDENDVLACTDPEEALAICRERDIGILLSDLQMPGMDGIELIHEATRQNPQTIAILVTGRATKDTLIQALNDGKIWKVIEKPWRADQLLDAVRQAVEKYARDIEFHQASTQPVARQIVIKPPQKKKLVMKRTRGRGVHAGPRTQPRARSEPLPRTRGRAVPTPRRGKWMVDKRYRDLMLIKEGGTGSVYKAEDSLLAIPVAIKVISDQFSQDPKAIELLFQEARIAMQLSHKHIVRLHNIEQCEDSYYLVMEYIDGDTFRDILKASGSLPQDLVLQIMDICEDALGYAHRRQVFHRDLKPENLMLTSDGTLKIIDFGLACLAENRMRNTDEIAGTPFYMSPEEIKGSALDQRADIYSLGVMIHEFLTGDIPPHADDEPLEDPTDYVPIPDEALPRPVQNVLQIAFAREPEDRWATVDDFADSLRAACGHASPA